MDDKIQPFWETKTLGEMSPSEWEALCDGCGRCCLEKIRDEDTGETLVAGVSCEFLDLENCRCSVYPDRLRRNPDCIPLSPENLDEIAWLPSTCAYRLIAEGRPLKWWHPLISGDPGTVHKAGISVRGKVVSGRYVHPDDIIKHVLF